MPSVAKRAFLKAWVVSPERKTDKEEKPNKRIGCSYLAAYQGMRCEEVSLSTSPAVPDKPLLFGNHERTVPLSRQDDTARIGAKFSERIMRHIRQKAGVTGNGLVSHSFRHMGRPWARSEYRPDHAGAD